MRRVFGPPILLLLWRIAQFDPQRPRRSLSGVHKPSCSRGTPVSSAGTP
jgi:hypothetical protein